MPHPQLVIALEDGLDAVDRRITKSSLKVQEKEQLQQRKLLLQLALVEVQEDKERLQQESQRLSSAVCEYIQQQETTC